VVVAVFAGVAAAGVLLSFGVERLLHGHLRRVLTDICGTDARSAFFLAVSALTIVLSGSLAATATTGYTDPNAGGFDLLSGALTQARTVMAGLLGVVIVIAFLLIGAIRRWERLHSAPSLGSMQSPQSPHAPAPAPPVVAPGP
jgi:hypothetical protein